MRYRADVVFESDMDEDDFALWLEDVLYSVSIAQSTVLKDLSIYEVCHMPGWGFSD